MKKWICIIMLTMLAGMLSACGGSSETVKDESGSVDFTVELASGQDFTLSEQKGKVVFINLWASWCGPCVRELPALCDLYEHYKDDEEVVILAINQGESQKALDKFVEEKGYSIPVAYDHTSKLGKLFEQDSIPVTMIFDKDGNLFDTVIGAPMDTSGLCDKYVEIIDGLK